jgi:hypothetical protein
METHAVNTKSAPFAFDAFDPFERSAAVAAVNRYGSGQHPAAAPDNLHYFTAAYVAECLTAALPHFAPAGRSAARSALAKLK